MTDSDLMLTIHKVEDFQVVDSPANLTSVTYFQIFSVVADLAVSVDFLQETGETAQRHQEKVKMFVSDSILHLKRQHLA